MIGNTVINNAQIPGRDPLFQIVTNSQEIIESIEPQESANLSDQDREIIDVQQDWISLGGVDLQINGGLGLAFPDLTEAQLPFMSKIAEFLWQQGVDAFLPTIVTTSLENMRRSLAVITEFMQTDNTQKKGSAQVLGVHLEGPFLNYDKRGAHQAEYLLPLNLENVKRIVENYTKAIKIITLAPELDPTGEAIKYLHSCGITISLGHSLATAEEAKKAFQMGASMVTHAFNAMPSLHHREPGLLGEAMINPQVYCGLIADGNHVCSTMIKLLLRASNYQQGIFLVSDALAPIGLPTGIYPWDNRQIKVKNGTARLADGTLAGTTLPLLVGVENLVKWGTCNIGEGIAMATESPRKAIGLPGIEVGQTANFLRWHWDEEIRKLSWRRLV